MAFHLWQVVERASAASDLFLSVVEEHQAEVEDAAGNALTVDQHMLFIQMPAAWTDLQGGDGVVEFVFLAGFVLERQLATDGVVQIDLALDLVFPVRAIRIFKVGHVRISARVIGVDNHLGFNRAGDFGAAAFQCLRQRGDLPVAFADVLGFRQKVWHFTGVDAGLALNAGLEQFLTARFKGAVQLGNKSQCFGRQDFVVTRIDWASNLNAGGQGKAHG